MIQQEEFKEIDKDFLDIPAYISSLDKDNQTGPQPDVSLCPEI